MSKLILDSYPLVIIPELAIKIGLNEAIVLQQIHYWLEINKKAGKNHYEGRYWVYNTYEGWQEQFPWWSVSTIKRILISLQKGYEKKEGLHKYTIPPLLISGNFNRLRIDQTKWYTINYENLEKISNFPLGQFDPMDRSIWTNGQVNLSRPIPETTTETTAEITFLDHSTSAVAEGGHLPYSIYSLPPEEKRLYTFEEYLEVYSNEEVNTEAVEAVRYFIDSFRRYKNKKHCRYSPKKWKEILEKILWLDRVPHTLDEVRQIIDTYFSIEFREKCNYHITHLLQKNVAELVIQKAFSD